MNPIDPRASRSLSQFDARHRFVLSYYWDLPIPKYAGFTGKVLNGWAVSGITTFQSGFPIRITSQDDNELMNSFDFELPGQPDQLSPFRNQNPHNSGCAYETGPTAPAALGPVPCSPVSNQYFDPNIFSSDTDVVPSLFGRIGNAKRTICCGPGINSSDISLQKTTPLTESTHVEFRADFFNLANHTQFLNPDGNITDGSDFGRIKRVRDPRQIQFALKLYF